MRVVRYQTRMGIVSVFTTIAANRGYPDLCYQPIMQEMTFRSNDETRALPLPVKARRQAKHAQMQDGKPLSNLRTKA